MQKRVIACQRARASKGTCRYLQSVPVPSVRQTRKRICNVTFKSVCDVLAQVAMSQRRCWRSCSPRRRGCCRGRRGRSACCPIRTRRFCSLRQRPASAQTAQTRAVLPCPSSQAWISFDYMMLCNFALVLFPFCKVSASHLPLQCHSNWFLDPLSQKSFQLAVCVYGIRMGGLTQLLYCSSALPWLDAVRAPQVESVCNRDD